MFVRFVALAIAAAAVLTACGGGVSSQPTEGPSQPVRPALAVVVGNHANSPSGITNADAYVAAPWQPRGASPSSKLTASRGRSPSQTWCRRHTTPRHVVWRSSA